MQFHETPFAGAYLLEIDPRYDERGFFASMWNSDAARSLQLEEQLSACNISYTRNRGTIRGLHYQTSTEDRAKIVRCIRGAVYHVIVDIRPHSRTYLKHYAFALRQDKYQSLYIPAGIAHGFQTLTDQCELLYHTDNHYHQSTLHGIRWDDPMLAIKWPLPVSSIAKRDLQFPIWTS